jgi:hypothetical protein
MIGVGAGLFFTLMMLGFGREFYFSLGGRGGVLEQSIQYSQVLFSGAISIWLVNTLASVLRGTGDMRLPSATLIATAIVQIAVGGGFGLGVFGLPRRPTPISLSPVPPSDSSASAPASISRRRARQELAGRCWPAPDACCWWASAAGGVGCAGLDLVCARRRRDGGIRARHGAGDQGHRLGQIAPAGLALHKFDLLLFRPAFRG